MGKIPPKEVYQGFQKYPLPLHALYPRPLSPRITPINQVFIEKGAKGEVVKHMYLETVDIQDVPSMPPLPLSRF